MILSRQQKAVRTRAGAAAVFSLAGVGLMRAQIPAAPRSSFEVASIKLNKTDGPETQHWGPQEIYLTRAGLLTTIADAYRTPYTRISIPKDSRTQELLRTNYDIAAKAPQPATRSELLLMLQSLFADRFKLAVHHDSKASDVYKLAIARGGPKLQESTTDAPASGRLIPGGLETNNMEMWRFCALLSGRMGRPVVDQTGLTGVYDLTLKLDTLEGISTSDPDFKTKISDWSSSSIFTDIQKQLGLQLVSAKSPVDYLVIDHIESPSQD